MRLFIRAVLTAGILLAGAPSVRAQPVWNVVVNDIFARANTSVGAAGSTTGVGNGWIDQVGGNWNIQSNALNGINANYNTGGLVRPTSEAAINQRAVADFVLSSNGTNVAVVARSQTSAATYYFADFEYSSGTNAGIHVYSTVSGAPVQLSMSGGGFGPSYVSGNPAVTVGHIYELDLSVTGSSPTTITYTITDLTAGGTSTTITGTDSTAGLQTAGAGGVIFFGGAKAATYSRVATYVQGVATPSLVNAPTSASISAASSTVSITATRTNSTAALTAAVSGGGTISTASPTSGTAFTYTSPASGSGTATVTVTDATDSISATTTISYAPTAATIVLSPTTLSGGSVNSTVSVSGSAINLTGSTFTMAGGYGSALISQTINSSTSATLVVNPGLAGNGALTITSSTGPTASLAVSTPSLGTMNLLVIGDSIAAGTNGTLIPYLVTYMQGLGYTITTNNQAIGGTGTLSWAQSYTAAAIMAAGAGITDVLIELGTNDVRTPNNLTPQQHNTNMRSIIKTLLAAYPNAKITIQHPLYTVPNAGFGTPNTWPNDPNSWYDAAWQLDLGIVDGIHVFAGDTAAYTMSMLYPKVYLGGDGIHPAPGEYNGDYARMWAAGLLHHYGAVFQRQSYQ